MSSGLLSDRLAVPGLVAPDLLAGQAEPLCDRNLADALRAGLRDRPAEREARLPYPVARGQVGGTRLKNFGDARRGRRA